MQNKNFILSTVRGLAIILVVYGHVIQRTLAPSGEDFFLNPAFKMVYTFHMPLFVLMSGYVMAYSLSRRSLWGAFQTRCKTLLVPFLAWGVLDVISLYLLDVLDGKSVSLTRVPWDVVNFLFLKPSVWFLFTLFVLSCMLLFSIRLEKKYGLITFFFIYFLILIIPYNEYCSLFYIKWFYAFYAAGYFLNRYAPRITHKGVHAGLLSGSIILFAVLLSYWTKSDYIYVNKMYVLSKNYGYEFLRILYRYAAAFLGITIVFYIGVYLAKTKMQYALDRIGAYSLDIYLIQRYVVEGLYPRVASKLPIGFDFNGPVFLCVIAPILTTIFVGGCILISKVLIRKHYWLNRLLLGGRV